LNKKISPWHRWVVIVTLLAKDSTDARRVLKVSRNQHNVILRNVKSILGVTTLNHAALKLNLLKINYDELPEWVGETTIEIEPGVSVDIEGE
jgi:hypothetical protein